jgi:uncharacterized membrane protein
MPKIELTADLLAGAVIGAALSAAVAMGPAWAGPNDAKGKEKCYGIAKAGENGCQSLSGSHTCGGCSVVDYSGEDWKWVAMGTCQQLGGQLSAFQGIGKPVLQTPTPAPR